MSVLQLSLNEARHLHLAAQGLLKKPRRRARPKDILSTIQQMSLLQIDTINVVARSPYLGCCSAVLAAIRSTGWMSRCATAS